MTCRTDASHASRCDIVVPAQISTTGGGVIGAALRLIPSFREDWIKSPFYSNEPVSQSISALCFVALCMYVWFSSLKRSKKEEKV